MRKILSIFIAVVFSLSLCSCLKTYNNEDENRKVINSWDCTVIYAEESDANDYVITYSDEKVITTTGILTLENVNDFGIVVYYSTDGNDRVEILDANSRIILYEISKNMEYTVGVHAEVTAGSEIKLLVHDGAMNLGEAAPLLRKPIDAQEAIEIAKNYFDETSKKTVTNFDNPNIIGIVGDENLFMIVPQGPEYVSQKKIIGKELYKITFNTEQDGILGSIVLYVDKYKAELLGVGMRM